MRIQVAGSGVLPVVDDARIRVVVRRVGRPSVARRLRPGVRLILYSSRPTRDNNFSNSMNGRISHDGQECFHTGLIRRRIIWSRAGRISGDKCFVKAKYSGATGCASAFQDSRLTISTGIASDTQPED